MLHETEQLTIAYVSLLHDVFFLWNCNIIYRAGWLCLLTCVFWHIDTWSISVWYFTRLSVAPLQLKFNTNSRVIYNEGAIWNCSSWRVCILEKVSYVFQVQNGFIDVQKTISLGYFNVIVIVRNNRWITTGTHGCVQWATISLKVTNADYWYSIIAGTVANNHGWRTIISFKGYIFNSRAFF